MLGLKTEKEKQLTQADLIASLSQPVATPAEKQASEFVVYHREKTKRSCRKAVAKGVIVGMMFLMISCASAALAGMGNSAAARAFVKGTLALSVAGYVADRCIDEV